MRKQGKGLCMAVLAAMAAMTALAIEAMSKFSLTNASEYARFTNYPSTMAEFTLNTVTCGREEVIRINRSIRNSPPEIKNLITGHLENSFLLGNSCYVGYEESTLKTWELPATTVGDKNSDPNSSAANIERNIQTQITHELSQLKNHLA